MRWALVKFRGDEICPWRSIWMMVVKHCDYFLSIFKFSAGSQVLSYRPYLFQSIKHCSLFLHILESNTASTSYFSSRFTISGSIGSSCSLSPILFVWYESSNDAWKTGWMRQWSRSFSSNAALLSPTISIISKDHNRSDLASAMDVLSQCSVDLTISGCSLWILVLALCSYQIPFCTLLTLAPRLSVASHALAEHGQYSLLLLGSYVFYSRGSSGSLGSSDVRQSSWILVQWYIQFDQQMLPVNCNSINNLIGVMRVSDTGYSDLGIRGIVLQAKENLYAVWKFYPDRAEPCPGPRG